MVLFGFVTGVGFHLTCSRCFVSVFGVGISDLVFEMDDFGCPKLTTVLCYSQPNICKLVAHFEDESTIWLILELISGGDLLEAVIHESGLCEFWSWFWFAFRVLEGVLCWE